MENHKLKFEIGFWHPFGPHAGESAEEIIKRKQQEIKDNGWTLWSFQYRTPETLGAWHNEIIQKKPKKVLVFCSDGVGAKSPKSQTKYCRNYTPINTIKSEKIPSAIKVPHPMGKKTKGSAFIVKDIIYPVDYEMTPVQWLYQSKEWRGDKLPTRSEYLVRPGQGELMRKFRVILELQAPYLAEIRV
ncbi:MAG: hypothetical protein V1719_02990 [Patescibacteria group bacterium]